MFAFVPNDLNEQMNQAPNASQDAATGFTPHPTEHSVGRNRYITSNDPRGYVPVYEYMLNGQCIMIDTDDGYVLWTSICKALGKSKADIVKMVESQPDLAPQLRRVKGGFLKIQGTWIPHDAAVTLARKIAWPIRHDLVPLFGPDFPDTCLSPDDPAYGQIAVSKRRKRRASQPLASTAAAQSPPRREVPLRQSSGPLQSQAEVGGSSSHPQPNPNINQAQPTQSSSPSPNQYYYNSHGLSPAAGQLPTPTQTLYVDAGPPATRYNPNQYSYPGGNYSQSYQTSYQTQGQTHTQSPTALEGGVHARPERASQSREAGVPQQQQHQGQYNTALRPQSGYSQAAPYQAYGQYGGSGYRAAEQSPRYYYGTSPQPEQPASPYPQSQFQTQYTHQEAYSMPGSSLPSESHLRHTAERGSAGEEERPSAGYDAYGYKQEHQSRLEHSGHPLYRQEPQQDYGHSGYGQAEYQENPAESSSYAQNSTPPQTAPPYHHQHYSHHQQYQYQ